MQGNETHRITQLSHSIRILGRTHLQQATADGDSIPIAANGAEHTVTVGPVRTGQTVELAF